MDFEHDRKPAFVNLAVWTVAAIWIIVLMAFLPSQRELFLLAVGGTTVMALLVVGVSPLLTPHRIEDGVLIVRQGWHSKAVIPLPLITKVQLMERIEAKEGVLLDAFNRTLVMTDSKSNGIRIQLKEAIRFPWAFWKKADVVIFDVSDPQRFIAEVGKAL
mgnify:CR=1 FL=1